MPRAEISSAHLLQIAGAERIVFDSDGRGVADDGPRLSRKSSLPEETV